jgi:hypothetical protein
VTNGNGGITSGLADVNTSGSTVTNASVKNTSTYNIGSGGRGTITFNINGSTAVSGVVYVVSASDLFFIRTDAFDAAHPLLSGEILHQAGLPFSGLPLVSTSVIHVSGVSSTSPTATSVGAGLVVSALGTLSGTFDSIDNGQVAADVSVLTGLSVKSASAGRGILTFGGNTFTFYATGAASGFVMDSAGTEVKTGMLEQQTLTPISLSAIASSYVIGSEVNSVSQANFESGVLSISLAGLLNGTVDVNAPGASGLSLANLLSGTLSLGLSGRVTIGSDVYYLIAPGRYVDLELATGNTTARVLVADN